MLTLAMYPVRQLATIVFPQRNDPKEAAPLLMLRWCLHLLFWTSLIGGLWYLNRWGGLERALRSSWPTLHRAWLPLIALLVYALGWLSRGLWLSLERDSPSRAWPDLASAWTEASAALERANISIREAPLYLILGPTTPELQALLESLGAAPISQRPNSPFHLFAHRDAAFLVCDQLSHLGMQGTRRTPAPSRDFAESATSRLEYLCRILALDRADRQPIQGVILIAAFSLTQSEKDAQALVHAAQNDLRVLRRATGLEVPLYVVVSGLSLPGADAKSATAWFQRFPTLPDQDTAEIRTMLHEGADWLFRERITADIRGHYRLDAAPTEDGSLTPALRENIRLYQWLCAAQDSRPALANLLVEGTQNDFSEPGMVAGCYFLAGDQRESQDALARALGEDLFAHQQTAAWTAEMIAAHEERRRRTWAGYALGLMGVALCLAGGGWQYFAR